MCLCWVDCCTLLMCLLCYHQGSKRQLIVQAEEGLTPEIMLNAYKYFPVKCDLKTALLLNFTLFSEALLDTFAC